MTPLQQLPLFVLAVLALLLGVKANTEKEIFLAPRWQEDQGVGDHLPQLMPSEHCRNCRSARLRLETDFTNDHEFFEDLGKQHWIRIDGLKEGQRYEVRVCWAATQPTDFKLDLFEPEEVLHDEDWLLAQVGKYPSISQAEVVKREGSTLFLRVFAKTAYFSANKTRMENPEPVDVDIILDPYVFNVVPESLLAIIGLIVVVAVASWPLGGWIHKVLTGVGRLDTEKKDA
ncbi:hypothetical protein FPQ18DRAFT_353196 [Pyronema domesticum]|uniref:Uncharacterized protein n=1 Tax=Pyronema omphalodes (strain CBS 100304) TaxID=1076935 RepID=U4L484_PYROM|nr:hypothetical protein FPQ18DRAFT_353196 [Pyronema domesticum]CCX07103.1 Similar to hypothetical protein [Botryotinia fuckeliana]; acc. no. CCD48394 [Pyronema omphalodes CBS 100304]